MDKERREGLIKFCVLATADLNGVEIESVDAKEFLVMTDDELQQEADWLDNLLSK